MMCVMLSKDSMRVLSIVAIVIAAENAALWAFCILQQPENVWMGITYLSWMVLPPLTASIALVNRRWNFAVAITCLVGVASWDYLLIAQGLFWGDGYNRTWLATIYASVGLTIGFASGGFVRVITDAIDTSTTPGHSNVVRGMKKGATFGSLLSLAVAPTFYLIGRPALSGRGPRADDIRRQIDHDYALISVGLLLLGIVGFACVGTLVGCVYRRKSRQTLDLVQPRMRNNSRAAGR